MTIQTKPQAEIEIDPAMVRALIAEQHPDLAGLPLKDLGEGWDNRLFRLGDALAVRLPRRAIAAPLIEQEQRWLPLLAPRLPLAVPEVRRVGLPGCGYPWRWSITAWVRGQAALSASLAHPLAAARDLGGFLRALHQPAPRDAPHNPWRAVPLVERTDALRVHLDRAGPLVDRRAAMALWDRAVAAPPWRGPGLWIHGDLHPGNLLVHEGRLSGVVDFGDLTAGDPATDLSVLWMLLPRPAWRAFLTAAAGAFDPLEEALFMRARGWALALGLSYLANSRDEPAMETLGLTTVAAALEGDHPM